ncbi:MAG: hypothetical protein JKY34_03600 [Kordiimonadaceae bacterium]|nr:hypothetical protein [Kordiimonadaceae bacterium]
MANDLFKTLCAAAIGGVITATAIVAMSTNDSAGNNAVPIAQEAPTKTYARPYDLLHIMHQFQRFADKLYFAGKAENERLTGWYLWKLEQAALHVTNHETQPWYPAKYDEAVLFEQMLFPAIADLNKTVEAKDWASFNDGYVDLIATCNACHGATAHEYIRIIIPTSPIYNNQDYSIPTD